MSDQFHGWHYHVESEKYSPVEMILLFEIELLKLGAKFTDLDPQFLYIGSIEGDPPLYRYWVLGEKTLVLWIGKYGKLHLEANKPKVYSKCIYKKSDFVKLLEGWKEKVKDNQCVFFQPEFENCVQTSCVFCTWSEGENCLIKETKAKLEADLLGKIALPDQDRELLTGVEQE